MQTQAEEFKIFLDNIFNIEEISDDYFTFRINKSFKIELAKLIDFINSIQTINVITKTGSFSTDLVKYLKFLKIDPSPNQSDLDALNDIQVVINASGSGSATDLKYDPNIQDHKDKVTSIIYLINYRNDNLKYIYQYFEKATAIPKLEDVFLKFEVKKIIEIIQTENDFFNQKLIYYEELLDKLVTFLNTKVEVVPYNTTEIIDLFEQLEKKIHEAKDFERLDTFYFLLKGKRLVFTIQDPDMAAILTTKPSIPKGDSKIGQIKKILDSFDDKDREILEYLKKSGSNFSHLNFKNICTMLYAIWNRSFDVTKAIKDAEIAYLQNQLSEEKRKLTSMQSEKSDCESEIKRLERTLSTMQSENQTLQGKVAILASQQVLMPSPPPTPSQQPATSIPPTTSLPPTTYQQFQYLQSTAMYPRPEDESKSLLEKLHLRPVETITTQLELPEKIKKENYRSVIHINMLKKFGVKDDYLPDTDYRGNLEEEYREIINSLASASGGGRNNKKSVISKYNNINIEKVGGALNVKDNIKYFKTLNAIVFKISGINNILAYDDKVEKEKRKGFVNSIKNLYKIDIKDYAKIFTFLKINGKVHYIINYNTEIYECNHNDDFIDAAIFDVDNDLKYLVLLWVCNYIIENSIEIDDYLLVVNPWYISKLFDLFKFPLIYNNSKQYFEYEYIGDDFEIAFEKSIKYPNENLREKLIDPINYPKAKNLIKEMMIFINKNYFYAIYSNHGLCPGEIQDTQKLTPFNFTYPMNISADLRPYSKMFYNSFIPQQRHTFFKNLINQFPKTSIIGPISLSGGSNLRHPSLQGLVDFYSKSTTQLIDSFDRYGKRLDDNVKDKIETRINQLENASKEFEETYELINNYKATTNKFKDPALNIDENHMKKFTNAFNNFVGNEQSLNRIIQKLQEALQGVATNGRVNANT